MGGSRSLAWTGTGCPGYEGLAIGRLLLRATDALKREMTVLGLLIINLKPVERVRGPPWRNSERSSFPVVEGRDGR